MTSYQMDILLVKNAILRFIAREKYLISLEVNCSPSTANRISC